MSTEASPFPSRAFAQEAIAARVARVQAQAPAARAQEVDGVHDLRVASRRLRAALRVMRPRQA